MISIILVTYNSMKYIRECLDTILKQTFKNYELIIVDDGSTDETVDFIQKEYGLKVERLEHKGAANARNYGIKKAQGTYLCILDSDDYFELDMLEKMYDKAKLNNADIVISSAYKFDNNTKEEIKLKYMVNTDACNSKSTFSPEEISSSLFQLTVANAWGKLFRKDLIINNNITFQDLHNSNDVLFVYSAIVNAKTITIIDEPLVHYRFNNKKSIQGSKKEHPYDFIEAYKELQNYLINKKVYDTYKQSFINMIINIFIWNIKSLNVDQKKRVINLLKERYMTFFKIADLVEKNDKYQCFMNIVGE